MSQAEQHFTGVHFAQRKAVALAFLTLQRGMPARDAAARFDEEAEQRKRDATGLEDTLDLDQRER